MSNPSYCEDDTVPNEVGERVCPHHLTGCVKYDGPTFGPPGGWGDPSTINFFFLSGFKVKWVVRVRIHQDEIRNIPSHEIHLR